MTVKITNTTMRDGHKSLLATRMRTLLCHPEATKGLSERSFSGASVQPGLSRTSAPGSSSE